MPDRIQSPGALSWERNVDATTDAHQFSERMQPREVPATVAHQRTGVGLRIKPQAHAPCASREGAGYVASAAKHGDTLDYFPILPCWTPKHTRQSEPATPFRAASISTEHCYDSLYFLQVVRSPNRRVETTLIDLSQLVFTPGQFVAKGAPRHRHHGRTRSP
jgi:hypothetical protein